MPLSYPLMSKDDPSILLVKGKVSSSPILFLSLFMGCNRSQGNLRKAGVWSSPDWSFGVMQRCWLGRSLWLPALWEELKTQG